MATRIVSRHPDCRTCRGGNGALSPGRQDSKWDEEDGFYCDLLRLPDGSATRLKVRSMVGLLPLCAATVTDPLARPFPLWRRRRVRLRAGNRTDPSEPHTV